MHFHCILLLVVAFGLLTSVIAYSSLSRSSFPPDFIFRAGSSAYQNEAGAKEDGKRPSIWDTFSNKYPEKVIDGSNGNVAADFYHKYKEDIKLMIDMNLDVLRLSFSWSRILLNVTVKGGVNEKGIDYYNNVSNELLANGIEPFVTIFHWDLPQALQDEYGGFLSPRIVDGVNVKGYFVWSFLDGFEWTKGHDIAVGLNYVDYKVGRRRIPKLSVLWFKDLLRPNVSFISRFHYCH